MFNAFSLYHVQPRTHWFLPSPAMAGDLEVVSNLVAMMKQHSHLEELEDSDTVAVLRSVLETVINDSCGYVSSLALEDPHNAQHNLDHCSIFAAKRPI